MILYVIMWFTLSIIFLRIYDDLMSDLWWIFDEWLIMSFDDLLMFYDYGGIYWDDEFLWCFIDFDIEKRLWQNVCMVFMSKVSMKRAYVWRT